ncbi:AraC family ligand binding domain-containing protein [Martelella sp. HB161492]|uniref:AraC family ligand binding domain-containing protein n=1 Tax=Martelella sp. HB161492 TaxID=2720726 RepID=UPI001FEDEDC4|nr:AraC family ligand binding domain-containing protein [Martelella sp. HB161492]
MAAGNSRIERIEARFQGNGFSPHRHDTYALGITLSGIQTFSYRGEARVSTAGRLIVLHPDELHDGGAGGKDGLTYRMLYLPPELIAAAGERAAAPLPFVGDPVADDPALRHALIDALSDLQSPLSGLQLDDAVTGIASALARMAGEIPRRQEIDRRAMTRLAQRLREECVNQLGSRVLEAETGLDRFTLARQFRAAFGTSPHRYLIQRRLDHARQMMARGVSLAEAATASGFADQAHMTRHFGRTYGMTPGHWRALRRTA